MVLAALFGTLGWAAGASGTSKSSSAKKKSTAASSTRKSSKRSVKKTSSRRRRSRRRSTYARLASFKMQPERAKEIQQVLIDRGYLNTEPSGVWDSATRAAMKKFQEDYQFRATGMPEAKSLMKLGLGPHPLPRELDPEFQTRAQADMPPASETDASARSGGSQ